MCSVGRATELAIKSNLIASAELCYGDCSESPIFEANAIAEFAARTAPHLSIVYKPYRENLGSARGHNRLLAESNGEAVLIQNPDVIPAPDAYVELMAPYAQPGVGMVEARQLPIEHPKDYSSTGETSWSTTACALIPRAVMDALCGFDADSFFLYCDDVDFSWRVRLAGFKVLFQPSAAVFHDKSLTPAGRWKPSKAEVYYSAEASLLLAHKWSRPERVTHLLKAFTNSAEPSLVKAANEFRRREQNKLLPDPIDKEHKVGEFTKDNFYAPHRYQL